MDPNETLRQMLLTAKQIEADKDPAVRKQHGDDLAELVLAMDEWIANGGFLPERWAR